MTDSVDNNAAAATKEEATDAPNAVCAFTVVVDGDGIPRVFPMGVEGVRPWRQATSLDIRRAIVELAADLQARAAAEYVVESLQSAEEPSVSERVSAALAEVQKSD